MGGARPPFIGPGRRIRVNPQQAEPVARQGEEKSVPIPPVPPVQAKARPAREDSLLEAIIKLLSSVMSFKRK